MTRPENQYIKQLLEYQERANPTLEAAVILKAMADAFEEGVDATNVAWRKKIEAVYGGPLPLSEYHDDLVGFLKWFVGQLLKEQSDDT